MTELRILWYIFIALWTVSVALWIVCMSVPFLRGKGAYLWCLIPINIFNIAIQITSILMHC